tara:strand:- start:30701 stop:31057 length:357 start_codon:yes stop_codon:yes gene_type:complete
MISSNPFSTAMDIIGAVVIEQAEDRIPSRECIPKRWSGRGDGYVGRGGGANPYTCCGLPWTLRSGSRTGYLPDTVSKTRHHVLAIYYVVSKQSDLQNADRSYGRGSQNRGRSATDWTK